MSPAARARIGLLFEGYLTYEFMTISQIERFYAPHYPRWSRGDYYTLVDMLGLPHDHVIKNMSCGQRSQVVLGLIMAQQPDLLILDDYSMGLDAGYRRLFLDYMAAYLKNSHRTVFLTSHVIQDIQGFVDEVLFLEQGGRMLSISLAEFTSNFRCFRLPRHDHGQGPVASGVIKNVETHGDYWELFTFYDREEVVRDLAHQQIDPARLAPVVMNLEDAFIGYTGRY